ncbi:phage major capsid family protein [Streptomyces lavendulae]
MALDATLAADHMTKRDAAAAKLKALDERYGSDKPSGAKETEERLLSEIAKHDTAVRALVGDAADTEARSALVNSVVFAGASQLPDDVQPRSLADVRVLGMPIGRGKALVFTERSADAIDALDTGNWIPAPVMLAEAPNGSALIGRVQTFPHSKTRGYVPIVPQLQANIAGRNEPLGPGNLENGVVGTFESVKVSAYVKAASYDLQDYAQLEETIDAAILSALGAGVDDVIVNGGSDGDVTITGLMDRGVSTTATVSAASVLNALARVKTARATPDTILMHPDTEAVFLGAIDGALIAKLPEIVALPSVPAGTAIVASLGNVAVAMRENLGVASCTGHPDLFSKDEVAFAGRARIGDVVVANSAHVQIVKPAA